MNNNEIFMDHSIPHSHREPIKSIINNNNTINGSLNMRNIKKDIKNSIIFAFRLFFSWKKKKKRKIE
jgi:hypothetical protein